MKNLFPRGRVVKFNRRNDSAQGVGARESGLIGPDITETALVSGPALGSF